MAAFSSSSSVEELSPQHQVFINFCGEDTRLGFVSHLVKALQMNKINVDRDEGQPLQVLLDRIEESRIALVIFSRKYTESKRCLAELAKIMDCLDEGKVLKAIPIYYNLDLSTVRDLRGQFGNAFRNLRERNETMEKWENALMLISYIKGFLVDWRSDESEIIEEIVKKITLEESQKAYVEQSLKNGFSPQDQVFINFSGRGTRLGFVSHLARALQKNNINIFIEDGMIHQQPQVPLDMIKESRIALVIFSEKYTRSKWPLKELAKIADCVDKLVAIPIFYKLDPSTVRGLRGQFGDAFMYLIRERKEGMENWKEALKSISNRVGIKVEKTSDESEIIEKIVKEVKRVLNIITLEERQKAYVASENSYTQTSSGGLIGEGGAINRIVDNVPKLPEYIPAERTEDPRDTYTERSSSDAKTNAPLLGRTFTNSRMDGKVKPPKIQVFINFRGAQVRNNFVGYLVDALRRSEINVFIDKQAQIGEDLNTLFKSIEDSGIAIVVFSSKYTESEWCLEELVKIKERVQQNLLKVIPIFYKVTPDNVKRLKGKFGEHFREKEYKYQSDEPKIKRWKEAIANVSGRHALLFDGKSSVLEIDFVESVVKEVLKMLQAISKVERSQASR